MGLGDLGVGGVVPKSGEGDASRDLLRVLLVGDRLLAVIGVVALDKALSSASEPPM